MSLTAEQKGEIYDVNAKLCRAVQQHPCLYDRSNAQYVKKPAYDAAWADIARQCEESVTLCKVRWRNIRTAFIRSVNNKPKKRMQNRTRDYYLHNVLEFFLPHITNLQDGEELHESDSESEESKKKKADANTSSEDLKKKSSQARADGESTTSAEETAADEPEPEAQLEKQPKKKSKVNTFYITEKQTKSGTFYIKKVTPNKANANELSATEAGVVAEVKKPETAKDSDTGSEKSKKAATRFRYRRNCKRGLDKTMISQLRVRKREPEVKRQRRSMERVKALTKAAALIVDANKAQLKVYGKPLEAQKAQKEVKLTVENNAIVTPSDVVETQMGYCQIPAAVAQPILHKALPTPRQLVELAAAAPAPAPARHCATNSAVDKAVQCAALAQSMDEEFLHSLKPYMSDMNARQKLHFKKKVYETLMEVFDNPADFPGMPAPAVANTPPPTAVELLSNEELRLVRELAAVVQAAKRTPELMHSSASENKNAEEFNSNATETAAMPSETATVDTINNPIVVPEATQSATQNAAMQPTPNAADSNTAQASSTPRHIIHKMVQVGENGSATLTTQKGEKRRIYRIFPRGTLSTSNENGAAVSSVGTFIIPRTSLSATTVGTASASTTLPSGTTTYRKIAIPASAVNWAEASILRATPTAASVMNRRAMTVRGRAQGSPRQLLRRYSICGTYPGLMVGGADNRMPTKIITTANKAQTSLTWSTGNANGNANVNVAGFKVPNAVSNAPAACKSTRTVAADAGVSAGVPSGANALSLSALLGTHASLPPAAAPTALNAEQRANAATPPERAGVKRSLRLKSVPAEKREKAETTEETAGTIASDDFAGLSIKPEPLDDCF